ncbi:MAG TPA: hypothetical protein VGK74_15045 [Symbiobacteriaceae bacterium]
MLTTWSGLESRDEPFEHVERFVGIPPQCDNICARVFGSIWMAAAPSKGGGKVVKFSVELTVEELLLVLIITATALHLSSQ